MASYNQNWKRTIEGRASVLFSNAKSRCKEKGVELHITQEWVKEQLKRGTCEITGIRFNLEPPTKGLTRLPDAPSLDRIDKNKHYTEDNTRVILWAVNCALAEYGTDVMLPILKAMIKGIKNVKPKSVAPVSDEDNWDGELHPQHRIVSTPGTWQNGNNPDNNQGTVQRKDADSSTQASSGDSMGHRGSEVGTSIPVTCCKGDGERCPAAGCIGPRCGYLPDKP